MPFLMALVQREKETALSRIWTWVADFIIYDVKHEAKLLVIYASQKLKSSLFQITPLIALQSGYIFRELNLLK